MDRENVENKEDVENKESTEYSFYISTSQDKEKPTVNWKEQEDFLKKLKSLNPRLEKVFNNGVRYPYRRIKQGERNASLMKMVTYFHDKYGTDVVKLFAEGLYKFYGHRFKDGLGRHNNEARSQIRALKTSFANKLSADERKIYESLLIHKEVADTFRICRSLAKYIDKDKDKATEKGIFYLACNELAKRLGFKHDQKADRILAMLEELGAIKVFK